MAEKLYWTDCKCSNGRNSKLCRANPLVLHTDKLKNYVGDTPSTWLIGGGGDSEDEPRDSISDRILWD